MREVLEEAEGLAGLERDSEPLDSPGCLPWHRLWNPPSSTIYTSWRSGPEAAGLRRDRIHHRAANPLRPSKTRGVIWFLGSLQPSGRGAKHLNVPHVGLAIWERKKTPDNKKQFYCQIKVSPTLSDRETMTSSGEFFHHRDLYEPELGKSHLIPGPGRASIAVSITHVLFQPWHDLTLTLLAHNLKNEAASTRSPFDEGVLVCCCVIRRLIRRQLRFLVCKFLR